MNDNGVCRTAPATPGLLNIKWVTYLLAEKDVEKYLLATS